MIKLRAINDVYEITFDYKRERFDFIIAEFSLVFQVFRLQSKDYNITIQRSDVMTFIEDFGLIISNPLLTTDFDNILNEVKLNPNPEIDTIMKICNCDEKSAIARLFSCIEIMRLTGAI